MSSLASQKTKVTYKWRVIDIIVAAILGVVCGLIFIVWNGVGYAWVTAMNALTPGLGGIGTGIWFIGGILGGLIIRKPGAALFVEVIAATVSGMTASQWGIETIYSGIAQGLGAELVFAFFAYRKFNLMVSVLAGLGSAVGAFVLELFIEGNFAKSLAFNVTYLVCLCISGVLLGGILCYYLVKGLAATGALDRFAAGREIRQKI